MLRGVKDFQKECSDLNFSIFGIPCNIFKVIGIHALIHFLIWKQNSVYLISKMFTIAWLLLRVSPHMSDALILNNILCEFPFFWLDLKLSYNFSIIKMVFQSL